MTVPKSEEIKLLHRQIADRDERIRELAASRDQEVRERLHAQERAKTADHKLEVATAHSAELQERVLQAEIERARLEGYRDRVRELDTLVSGRPKPTSLRIHGVDLAAGPDQTAVWR